MNHKPFQPGIDTVSYGAAVFDETEIDAVVKALRAGWLGPGEITSEFESRVAALFGKKYGLFVNSGTSANMIAMEIADLPKGSEIITQACTFPVTLSPILFSGHVPVFVDSKIGTYNIDLDRVESAISPKTKAIFISHILGNLNDMERLRDICDKHSLLFIEDSCDTHGGLYQGKPTGKWSDIITTSFYPTHSITAGGGGGMVMTDNKDWIEKARMMRDWGRDFTLDTEQNLEKRLSGKVDGQDFDQAFIYLKWCMNLRPVEMQAAFGLVQLDKLPKFNEIRKRNFQTLFDFFRKYEGHFILPESLPDSEVFWFHFPLTIRPESPIVRKDLVRFLEKNKIQTRPLFTGNILRHPGYKNIPHRIAEDLQNADLIMKNSFIFGCHHGMTEEMLHYLMETFFEYLKHI